VNINAYHQPGVEAGKKAAATVLNLQQDLLKVLKAERTGLSLEALVNKAGASENVEQAYKILRHLAANDRGIVLEGNLAQPASLKISYRA
jgi:glucose-6-phosphate isomerase